MKARVYIKTSICLALLAASLCSYAEAQQSQVDVLPGNLCFTYERATVPFPPTKAYAIFESGYKDVQIYPADYLVTSDKDEELEVLVGAKVFWDRSDNPTKKFFIGYVFEGVDDQFSSAPINLWTTALCRESTKGMQTLSEQTDAMAEQLKTNDQTISKSEVRLQQLREIVAQIAGVGEIVKLRTQLAGVKARVNDLQTDKDRLKRLLIDAQKMSELEDADIFRRELSLHLQETAKATAMADRLTRRKRQAAIRAFQEKVAMIKETSHEDPKALSKLVLDLRAERKRLESKLGIANNQDEF